MEFFPLPILYWLFFSILFCRAVYDGDDLDKFMQRLDSRIKNHDKEIERMCNHHYQGFIDSVRELLQVSNDAAKLKVKRKKKEFDKFSLCFQIQIKWFLLWIEFWNYTLLWFIVYSFQMSHKKSKISSDNFFVFTLHFNK